MSSNILNIDMAEKIEIWEIEKLTPYDKNARTHSAAQVEKIAASMSQFGFTNPILVDSNTGIIAGHGRLQAAKLLGLDKVPVIILDHLNEHQKRAYILADNRLALDAGWDTTLLHEELKWLDDQDFDLELTGFSEEELSAILEPTIVEPEEEKQSTPQLPKEAKTKFGDIYFLGKHRLMCGDSTMIDDVEKLMDGEKADLVFTDPPYNIDYKPNRGTHDKILNDSMDSEKFKEFLTEVFACASTVTKNDSYAFVWSGWSTIDQFAPILRNFYQIKAMPIWVKNNFGIGYFSRPKYEPFFLCLKGSPEKPETAPADVWEFAKVYDTIHSCEKPVGLIENIINTYTKKGSVLDLFSGSGSTMIACEKSKRKSFNMELDPKYCDVIISRWCNYIGNSKIELNGQEIEWQA